MELVIAGFIMLCVPLSALVVLLVIGGMGIIADEMDRFVDSVEVTDDDERD